MNERDIVKDGIEEIKGIYRRAQEKIVKELTRVGISPYKEVEATKVVKRVRNILSELTLRTNDWAERSVRDVYKNERRKLKVSFEILGKSPVKSGTKRLNSAMDATFSAIVGDLAKARRSIKRSVDLYLMLARKSANFPMKIQEFDEDDIDELSGLFEGLAEEAVEANWSRKRLSDMIERKLSGLVDEDGLITINGRNFAIDTYAELVARTQLREAQTEATKAMCDEYDCDLVVFSSHNQPCDECAELEGQVFSISGDNPDWPELTDETTPPIHPNCEHSISPTSDIAREVNREYGEAVEEG